MNRFIGIITLILSLGAGIIFCSFNGSIYDNLFVPPKAPTPVYTTDNEPVGGPEYPVSASKEVRYRIHNCPVTKDTVVEVDKVLEDLNAAHIAQTIFLCMNKSDITQPVPYAERFLRYMGLGMADGQRKNNGVVFLISYDDKSKEVRVNYAVGLGLPALTAPDFGNTAREALNGSSFNVSTKYEDLDVTIKALARAYDKNVRVKYEPYQPVEPKYGSDPTPESKNDYAWIFYLAWLYYFALGVVVNGLLSIAAIFTGQSSYLWGIWYYNWWPLDIAIRLGLSGSLGGNPTKKDSRPGHVGDGGGESRRGG